MTERPDSSASASITAVALTEPSLSRQAVTRDACLELLALGGHGRVAATMRAVPIIIPVTFALRGEDIVFSPGPSDDLSRAVTNSVIAFEADHVDRHGDVLWGVHVTGVARTSAEEAEDPGFLLSSEIITGWKACR